MKLTKQSELLMSFFIENKCITSLPQTKKTDNIFLDLYYELKDAENYINSLKKQQQKGEPFYNVVITEIQTYSQIAKPTSFPVDGFPEKIREHINEKTMNQLCYSITFMGRNVKIYFLVEELNPEKNIKVYNSYVDHILMWLVITNEYASKTCAEVLTIYLYFTSLKKEMPASDVSILGEYHVNTAFTMTCPKNAEIVIFRKEEWFKVFLHETFHNFGLDFSDMNNRMCNAKILNIFPVKSDVNLFEAYAEFWAKIMNIVFCSYLNLKNKSDVKEFLTNTEFFANFERIYSFFQMVKVLDFMNLSYDQLYKKGPQYDALRDTLYKEHTSVLSYYVITLILMDNYQLFIDWCNINNTSLLQFKKTTSNQEKFCDFILTKYKSSVFLKRIRCVESLLEMVQTTITKQKSTKKNKKIDKDMFYIMNNLRMTICELG